MITRKEQRPVRNQIRIRRVLGQVKTAAQKIRRQIRTNVSKWTVRTRTVHLPGIRKEWKIWNIYWNI